MGFWGVYLRVNKKKKVSMAKIKHTDGMENKQRYKQ